MYARIRCFQLKNDLMYAKIQFVRLKNDLIYAKIQLFRLKNDLIYAKIHFVRLKHYVIYAKINLFRLNNDLMYISSSRLSNLHTFPFLYRYEKHVMSQKSVLLDFETTYFTQKYIVSLFVQWLF